MGNKHIMGTEPKNKCWACFQVPEIIEAARRSQETGMRIKLKSKFPGLS